MLQCVHLLFKNHIYVIHTHIHTYIHAYIHTYMLPLFLQAIHGDVDFIPSDYNPPKYPYAENTTEDNLTQQRRSKVSSNTSIYVCMYVYMQIRP